MLSTHDSKMQIKLLERATTSSSISLDQLAGFWLNLKSDHDRDASIRSQLSRLGSIHRYQRIDGIIGDPNEALQRGLKPGEWGCWQGWMSLLDHAAKQNTPIVHLLEDDTELDPTIYETLQEPIVQQSLQAGALLCTDAYINPHQAAKLLLNLQSKGQKLEDIKGLIHSGLPCPTLNSVFLAPQTASKLLDELKNIQQGPLLKPIDLTLNQCSAPFITTLPFLSAPCITLASQSRIRDDVDPTTPSNRLALTLLRRCLMRQPNGEQMKMDLVHLLASQAREGLLKPY